MNNKNIQSEHLKTRGKSHGSETQMNPKPISDNPEKSGCNKLLNKVAIITGGDSGIGKAVAIDFAKEGADVFIMYLDSHDDANITKKEVEKHGRKCEILSGDVGNEDFCLEAIETAISKFKKIDILVNNAGEQSPQQDIRDITSAQLMRTFQTNIFSMFYLVKAALQYMKEGATIINTASVTAYKGNPMLIDYSSTKGAIVTFTRSLSQSLISKGIRVNAVAPGPIWTPLIPSTFPDEKVEKFGKNTPMQRAGEPEEVSPSYVFLASDDSSYMSGQVLHPNGGTIING